MASSTAGSSSPCAACKFLRRKCTSECVFAPYFPPDNPHKFANVHKIFGASNITKLLNELPTHQREDAVNSLAYEAEARVKDPVYGCVGAISVLQRQVAQLQNDLAVAHSDLARYAGAGMVVHRNEQSREQLIADLSSRDPSHLSREHLMELARVGGGPYEAGLASLGIGGGLGAFSSSHPRPGVDSGSRSGAGAGPGAGGGGGSNAGAGQMSSP